MARQKSVLPVVSNLLGPEFRSLGIRTSKAVLNCELNQMQRHICEWHTVKIQYIVVPPKL